MKRALLILIAAGLIGAGGSGAIYYYKIQPPKPVKSSTPIITSPSATTNPPAGFSKQQFSLDDPTSLWLVVNKLRPLQPLSYQPTDLVVPKVALRAPGDTIMRLRQPTATALEALFAAAQKDGLKLSLSSGYRSHSYQASLYASYVKTHGQAQADTFSARPGFSEHQTGLAADIQPLSGKCNLEVCFSQLPEGKWLATHAHEHGFIIRYPADATDITGYTYEPWHIRFVGQDLATEMKRQNIATLEEFFGLAKAADYKR